MLPIYQIIKRYLENISITKILYSLIKAKNYQFAKYLDTHIEKLDIKILSYNIYLLITKNEDINLSIIEIQIDNTFNIRIEIFINKKEVKIIRTKFKAKL